MAHKGFVAVLGVLLGACPLEVYGMPGGGGGGGAGGGGGTDSAGNPICNAAPGEACPGACFTDMANQDVSVVNGQIQVSLKQCFKSSAISFISVAETDANGNCGTCSKIEEVAPGASFYDFSVPVGTCKKTLCVYVHDGQFRRESPEIDPSGSNCISTANQRCQLCAFEKIDIDLAGACNDDNNLCTVGQCTNGMCVEPLKDCSNLLDEDECKNPECDPLDGDCKLFAVPDTPETTCGSLPTHPECQKSVCIEGNCEAVNINDQGACDSSGAMGVCQVGKCNAGVCEIVNLTTECDLQPAVPCKVGKCDGAGACGAVPVANTPAVPCTLDGPAGVCATDPVCVDGSCAAGTATGADCEGDDNLCTVGTCSATGACDETAKDCSIAITPGDDEDCQAAVCDNATGTCGTEPTNEGGVCGASASGNRKLFDAASCKTCVNGACVEDPDCGGPPPPPVCEGPKAGEECFCTDANCSGSGDTPCCEGLCVEGNGMTKVCGGDLTCIDQGGECVPGADPEAMTNPQPICCPGSVCVLGSNGKGTCVNCPFGCSQCPSDAEGVCTDVGANQPAQATCGTDTCTSVCDLICGLNLGPDDVVDPENCSNQGGGNCQNVFTLAGENYKGGPCCKCTTDCAQLKQQFTPVVV